MKKKSLKDFFQSLLFLKIVFLFLLLLIFILGILIYQKEKKERNQLKADFTIPILREEGFFEFGVDLLELSKAPSQEYIFKITNYKKEIQNSEDITYEIVLDNPTNQSFLIKWEEEENILKSKEAITLTGTLLKSKKEVYYHVFLTTDLPIDSDEILHIKITSERLKK